MQAASPDEVALVNFAKLGRFEFLDTDENSNMVVKHGGKEMLFPQLQVLKFSSDR